LYSTQDPGKKQAIREEISQNSKAIQELALSVLESGAVIKDIIRLDAAQIRKVGQLGGYSAIKKRLSQRTLSKEDKLAIVLEIKQRCQLHQRSLSRNQSRGSVQKN